MWLFKGDWISQRPVMTHAWLQILPLLCVNSSQQDSERMSLEHTSHGLLVIKRGAHWENPTALSSDEGEIQSRGRTPESLTAYLEIWVVSHSQGSICCVI